MENRLKMKFYSVFAENCTEKADTRVPHLLEVCSCVHVSALHCTLPLQLRVETLHVIDRLPHHTDQLHQDKEETLTPSHQFKGTPHLNVYTLLPRIPPKEVNFYASWASGVVDSLGTRLYVALAEVLAPPPPLPPPPSVSPR